MKGKKKSLVLTAVILATVMLATTIALAEPPFPEAPVKIEHEVKESTMELYYVCSGSSRHAFATEAELCNFLGVDYMTPRPLELCQSDRWNPVRDRGRADRPHERGQLRFKNLRIEALVPGNKAFG